MYFGHLGKAIVLSCPLATPMGMGPKSPSGIRSRSPGLRKAPRIQIYIYNLQLAKAFSIHYEHY